MSSDGYIKFEEQNFDWLVEKFIKKEQEAWMNLIESEYEKWVNHEPGDDR